MSDAALVEDREERRRFNESFRPDRYDALLSDLDRMTSAPPGFRVCETPVFLSVEFSRVLESAAEELVGLLRTPGFKVHAASAIPPGHSVPNPTEHTLFLQIDFAVARLPDGTYEPRLVELQGFPSLYCYQVLLDDAFRKNFGIGDEWTPYFGGLNRSAYLETLKQAIVGNADPAEVVLLEIEPEKQKTRIDFGATFDFFGVRAVDVSAVKRRGKRLFYHWEGKEIPIRRIYNRVIFDELEKKKPPMEFRFQDDLDVAWVGHPNWYYWISKHSLPFLKSRFVPESRLVAEYSSFPPDLENYVLKPLYSFAGGGVTVDVKAEDLKTLKHPDQFILQRKIEYIPFVETPDEASKAEIRMMYLWDDRPRLVNNLVRMSKGAMMGVDFNKNKTWVGSSIAYHRRS